MASLHEELLDLVEHSEEDLIDGADYYHDLVVPVAELRKVLARHG